MSNGIGDKMALVRRGNVELEVNDAFLDKYLAQGFNQIDTSGKIIGNGTPNNYTDLKILYDKLLVEYKSLEAKYKELLDKQTPISKATVKAEKETKQKTTKK